MLAQEVAQEPAEFEVILILNRSFDLTPHFQEEPLSALG